MRLSITIKLLFRASSSLGAGSSRSQDGFERDHVEKCVDGVGDRSRRGKLTTPVDQALVLSESYRVRRIINSHCRPSR